MAEFVNYTRQHGILKARFLEASSDEKHLQARNEHIIQSIDQLQKTVKIGKPSTKFEVYDVNEANTTQPATNLPTSKTKPANTKI